MNGPDAERTLPEKPGRKQSWHGSEGRLGIAGGGIGTTVRATMTFLQSFNYLPLRLSVDKRHEVLRLLLP